MSSNIPALDGADDQVVDQFGAASDPSARPLRRTFTAGYRARVVAEYEAAPHGEKSAVLRREGPYQSQVRRWAAARDALAPRDLSTAANALAPSMPFLRIV